MREAVAAMRNIRTKTGLVALALLALLVLYPFVEAYWMFWRPPQGGQLREHPDHAVECWVDPPG